MRHWRHLPHEELDTIAGMYWHEALEALACLMRSWTPLQGCTGMGHWRHLPHEELDTIAGMYWHGALEALASALFSEHMHLVNTFCILAGAPVDLCWGLETRFF